MNKVAAHPSSVDADDSRIARETAPALLTWYDRHRRDLPWRSGPGVASDPYRVWLSEIMLQQTTVTAVKSYYAAFLAAWPTVEMLARAPVDDILKAWAGLGYYSRARNLHACARMVVDAFGARFPEDEPRLRGLPGIGRYTAAAIAAIAFHRRAVVVDGNVERVMARLFAIDTPLPQAKPHLHAAMDRVTPAQQVGDFAQAVMDLGATICTPRTPACGLCPLTGLCRARRQGLQQTLPRKAAKKAVPHRTGDVIVIRRRDGAILVRQRPANGLFGGMTEFPTTAWVTTTEAASSPLWPAELEETVSTAERIGSVHHGLTHFSLELRVHMTETLADMPPAAGMRWSDASSLDQEAFPTLMRKVLALARQKTSDASVTLGRVGQAAEEIAPLLFNDPAAVDSRRSGPGSDASRRRRGPRSGGRRTQP